MSLQAQKAYMRQSFELLCTGDIVAESVTHRFRLLAAEARQQYVSHCYVVGMTLKRQNQTQDQHGCIALLLTTGAVIMYNSRHLTIMMTLPLSGIAILADNTLHLR